MEDYEQHNSCTYIQNCRDPVLPDENTATCIVCMKLVASTDLKSCASGSYKHFGAVCGIICEKMQVFLQAFLFCKVVCSLLDINNDCAGCFAGKQIVSTEDKNMIPADKPDLDFSHPDSPCSHNDASLFDADSPVVDGRILETSLSCEPVTKPNDDHAFIFKSEALSSITKEKKKESSLHCVQDKCKYRDVRHSHLSGIGRKKLKFRRNGNIKNVSKGQVKVFDWSNALPPLHSKKQKRKGLAGGSKELDATVPLVHGDGGTVSSTGSFMHKGVKLLNADTSDSEKLVQLSLCSKNPKKKIMVCRLCGKKCIGQVGLSVHTQNRHVGEKPVECEICGERFTSSSECEKHRKKIHGKMEGVCDICGKHFRYRHALQAHIKAHTGVKGFVCEQCGKSFMRMTTLCTHRKRAHRCRVCGTELFSSLCPVHPSLSQSKEKHPSIRLDSLNMLQCRECNKTLESLQGLKTHIKDHRLQRPFCCQVCGSGFRTLSSLCAHRKQHQEKMFKCSLCDKAFTYKCNMQKHLETHVEGRPFQCEFCNKTFKTKGVMENHKALHVEDRQYKCRLCGKGLTRLQTLKNHMVRMHPDSGII